MRPAVANDGGDITFRGFKDGVVYLNMKGSCAGCPSSTATLQHGIQNLLRHFVPDVTEVRPMLVRRGAPRTSTVLFSMRVLAIDTALAACSAAVLDTASGGIVASESLVMARGHAEALMPLVARVMQTSGVAFARSRPHRGDDRTRQLHRDAGRYCRRPRLRRRH